MHPGLAAAQRAMVGVLAEGIEERDGKTDAKSRKALEAGVEALAKCLGPVAGMFVESKYLSSGTLPLCEDVKQLPFCAMKRLLASEDLHLPLENDAYALLQAWLEQSPHAESDTSDDDDGDEDEEEEEDADDDRRLALFKELAPLLRYHHMTTDFLANVVSICPMMQQSGLMLAVIRTALVQRDALPSLLNEKAGKSDRGFYPGPSLASWELKARFTLQEVAALEPDEGIYKWCGLVAGYPASLQVERQANEGEEMLGAFLGIHMPSAGIGVDDTLAAGVGLEWTMTLPPDVVMGWDPNFFTPTTSPSWGWSNVFNKPWAEVVRGGSPHFPGGKLEAKATVKLALKKK